MTMIGLRTRFVLAAAVLAMAPAIAQSQDAGTMKIGLVASITGPGSFLGDPFLKGAKLAIDRANAAGGVNGTKIELVSYDTEGSPDKSLVFVKQLIFEDKVSVILGPDFTSTVNAVLPTTEEAKIPVLYNTPVVEPKPHSYSFTPWPSEETAYRVAMNYLKSRGIKRIAALAATDATGQSGLKQVQTLAPMYGITLGATERMDLQDTDVTAQLTNIKRDNPEAVFAVGSGAVVAVICKAYVQLGMRQPLSISTGAVSATFPELLKGITPDALIFPTYKMTVFDSLPANDPNREAIATLLRLYQETYHRKADFFAGAGWDLASIAIEAMKKGGNDRTKIRDAIEGIRNYPGTMATLTFTKENHRGAGPEDQVMGQFKDDKFILLQ
jgi:branched-chain amino acid transport system substrate-binding protein